MFTQTSSLYRRIRLVHEKETQSDTQRLYEHIRHIKGERNYSLGLVVYTDIFAFMKRIHNVIIKDCTDIFALLKEKKKFTQTSSLYTHIRLVHEKEHKATLIE